MKFMRQLSFFMTYFTGENEPLGPPLDPITVTIHQKYVPCLKVHLLL